MTRPTLVIIPVLLLLTSSVCHAQVTARGVTWGPVMSTFRAVDDLVRMSDMGITAVRTGPVTDNLIFEAADSLGITLYREIPFFDYPSRRLADSTLAGKRFLEELLVAGKGHRSAGPIGLAVRPDVSDPGACIYFETLGDHADYGEDQLFYYVSSFVESDTCAQHVDFVILDTVSDPDPRALIQRWHTNRETPIGILLGEWVRKDGRTGLQVPHSPEYQARYLETGLNLALSDTSLTAVFVHLWRDPTGFNSRVAMAGADMYNRQFGLQDAQDIARPSMSVVTGLMSGGQNIFAFARDTKDPEPPMWYILMGWMLIGVVAVLYSASPRFRYMTPRYFIAHGFFRNAVREAREVLPIVSTALLSVVGIAIGMLVTQFLIVFHNASPVILVVRTLPVVVQSAIAVLIESPIIATLFLGSIALLAMAIWMALWMVVAIKRAPLLPSQALMLAVWPRWQLLCILPVTMSIFTLDPESQQLGMLMILPVWIGSSLWAGARTAFDVTKLTRCAMWQAISIWILHPTVLLILTLLVLAVFKQDRLSYVLHLIIRS